MTQAHVKNLDELNVKNLPLTNCDTKSRGKSFANDIEIHVEIQKDMLKKCGQEQRKHVEIV